MAGRCSCCEGLKATLCREASILCGCVVCRGRLRVVKLLLCACEGNWLASELQFDEKANCEKG